MPNQNPPTPIDSHAYLHALLVGVEDYRSFDPDGSTDLAGSVRDTQLWRGVLDRMGLQPGNAKTLTAPIGGGVGTATGPSLRTEFGALLKRVSATGPGQGVFVFAGHGSFANGQLSLIPSDHSDATPTAVPLTDLLDDAKKAKLAADQHLTLILDCCFGDGDGTALRSRLLPGTPPGGGERLRALLRSGAGGLPDGVTLFGAGESAFEHYGAEGWVGGFSHAATHTLSRWTPFGQVVLPGGDADGAFWDVSYLRWAEAIQQVLTAFDAPLALHLGANAPAPHALAAFQNARSAAKPTFVRPTASVRRLQLDPGVTGIRWYDLECPPGTVIGRTIAIGGASKPGGPSGAGTWRANSEYWDLNLAAIAAGAQLKMVDRGGAAPPAGPVYPDRWRVDTAASVSQLATGSLPVGRSWVVHGSALPAFHIERPSNYTEWIRVNPAVNVSGTTLWDAITAPYGYTQKYRTVDTHLAYTS